MSDKITVKEFNTWQRLMKRGDSFLDIGCWDGSLVSKLLKKGVDAFGIDIDKDKLALADFKIKDRLKLADATKTIPFKQKFDFILLSEVLEHVNSEEELIKNVSKCLKKQGYLILTTPRSVRGFQIWDPAWVRWKFGGAFHHHYTLEQLQKLLSKQNIIIEKYAIGGSLSWVISRWWSVLIRYGLKINTKLTHFSERDGFCDFKLIARKK